jgi:hypothetical protein
VFAVVVAGLTTGLTVGLVTAGVADAADLGKTATRRTVERLVHRAYPDLVFGNIACPDRVAKRKGTKFTCTVQLPGTFLVVDAFQSDGSGNTSFTSPQAVISQQILRQFVAVNSSLAATVDCGPGPWRVARPGTKIICSVAFADGTTGSAELTVNDTVGNVTITAVS